MEADRIGTKHRATAWRRLRLARAADCGVRQGSAREPEQLAGQRSSDWGGGGLQPRTTENALEGRQGKSARGVRSERGRPQQVGE